jgi:hypothetical protein
MHDWVDSFGACKVLDISTSPLASMRILAFHFSFQSSNRHISFGLEERLAQLTNGDLKRPQNFHGQKERYSTLFVSSPWSASLIRARP